MIGAKFILIAFFGCFFFQDVYSYIDPGTTGYLLQMLIAVFAGGLYFVKVFWSQIKTFTLKTVTVFKRNK